MARLEVATPSRAARAVIDDVAAEMSASLDETASLVTQSIHENIPGLDDDLFLASRQSTRANLGLITTLISQGADPTVFATPEEALSYARSYVHEGLSLEMLTRAYHQGQKALSRLWLERMHARAETADELADAMGYFSDWLFSYIETINYPLSEVYTAEHERWIRGSVAMRSEEVRSILAGSSVHMHDASTRLRYRLDGRHVGFVIWNDLVETCETGLADGVFGEMDRYAAEVADCLSATSCLALPIGRYYAGWAMTCVDPEEAQLPAGRSGLRVALGRPGRGIAGFRRSHQEALLARRVAALSARATPACTTFDSIAFDALITGDLDEARRFVAHELGGLLEDSDSHRRLAATVEVFLHEESSFVRAARRLGIHENTVAYRIRRAEELLGRKVSERQLELRAALRLARFSPSSPPD